MLQTIPTITTDCMFAQDEIARRFPPKTYTESFLAKLLDENPAIFEWIMVSWSVVVGEGELSPERDLLGAVMVAHMGIMYSAIKAQIEGEQLDRDYGVNHDTDSAGEPGDEEKHQRGRNNNDPCK